MLEIYNNRKEGTNLKTLRLNAGLSQSELAEISDIPVRTIQQYEQKQKNINAAKAETVVKLAKAQNTSVEKLEKLIKSKDASFAGFYSCPGYDTWGPFKLIGGKNKNHPDENDIEKAIQFYENLI